MLRDISFGQYYPVKSFVHNMDARIKIVLSTLYLVGIFFIKSFFGFGVVLLYLITALCASRLPIKMVLKSVKPIMFLIVFTGLLNLFLINDGNVLVEWWIFRITEGSVIFAARMTLRLIFLVLGSSFLTFTTTPVDLTCAIESLLRPLNAIKFPVHEVALIMSIALRFIPSLMDETDRIIRAQKARGANFDTGGLMARAKAFVPILIPLILTAFRISDELALAMEARCYHGSAGRTRMRKAKTGFRDFIGFFVFLCFVAAATLITIYGEVWFNGYYI